MVRQDLVWGKTTPTRFEDEFARRTLEGIGGKWTWKQQVRFEEQETPPHE